MAFTHEGTTRWVAEKLNDLADVSEAKVVGEQLVSVSRNSGPTIAAIVLSTNLVQVSDIQALVNSNKVVDIVVNVPSQARWSKEAVQLCLNAGIAFGGMSGITSAIEREIQDVRMYPGKELAFVEGGLTQHSRVTAFFRDDERSYTVERKVSHPCVWLY